MLCTGEKETQHWPPSRVSDDLDAGVLETGASGHLHHPSEGASVDLESKSAPPRGKGELSQEAHAAQWEEETQHWPPHEVQKGLDAGVFETDASEHQCHASEGASVDVESNSAATLGEEDLSKEAHAVQREVGSGGGESHCEGSRDSNTRHEAALGSYEVRVDLQLSARTLFHDVEDSPRRSAQHACPVQDDTLFLHLLEEGEHLQRAAASVQRPTVGVLETEASECEGSSGNVINIGDTDLVLHSGSPLTTHEGDVKGGHGTFGEARLRGEEEGEEEPVVETRFHDDEEGEEPVGEANLFRGEVSARLYDDEAGEETVGGAQLSAGEVSAWLHAGEVSARQMGSERTNHDSQSTSCGEEQGDRASALISGLEMVLHEATELVSDSAAIELVSDSAVVKMQNIESSTDVGAMAREEAGSPRRTPGHGKICEQ
ncbi:hypothetical protein CBR_g57964 [Chara braunii]|uniref:Uncharacterized protein n=1 Tax=Chara braunii TaxID=69332 RepID=A0A388MEH4_CHABU|nr:hypothetical protein CBR_g57964 [Chara braunii]|eukprot:GBG92966.1 hypothetical protein CBR_g57964 [Chara braunii]